MSYDRFYKSCYNLSVTKKFFGLKCKECSKVFPAEALHVCEFCFGPLEVDFNYDWIKDHVSKAKISSSPLNLWRYWDFLPVDTRDVVTLGEGFTPLIKSKNIGKYFGLKNLYIKNDSVNPTLSFKDRVVTVALTRCRELGFKTVSCASTGNLAGSLSAYGAVGGFHTVVFIPHDLESAKIVGAAVHNPVILSVRGTYDEVNRLCSEVADNFSWGFVNVNMRPYYSEGSKTLGFEVAEQLGWKAPDHVVVPVASGSLSTKIYKGLNEFYNLGFIDAFHTKISIAQSTGCCPVVTSVKENTDIIKPVIPNTIAKSIAIGDPADGYYSKQIVKNTGGSAESASDEEIIQGIRLLAKLEGIFTETAGGTTVAVLQKLVEQKKIEKDELVVLYITGNGFKTQDVLLNDKHADSRKFTIEANMKDFQAIYDNRLNKR